MLTAHLRPLGHARRPRPGRPRLGAHHLLVFPGFQGCRCHCFIHHFGDLVIVTDPASNRGTSVTNVVEQVATSLCTLLYISPRRLRLITRSHYEPARFSQVFLDWDGARFVRPAWAPLPEPCFIRAEWAHLPEPYTTVSAIQAARALPPADRAMFDLWASRMEARA